MFFDSSVRFGSGLSVCWRVGSWNAQVWSWSHQTNTTCLLSIQIHFPMSLALHNLNEYDKLIITSHFLCKFNYISVPYWQCWFNKSVNKKGSLVICILDSNVDVSFKFIWSAKDLIALKLSRSANDLVVLLLSRSDLQLRPCDALTIGEWHSHYLAEVITLCYTCWAELGSASILHSWVGQLMWGRLMTSWYAVNSLWPGDAIWCHRSGSTLNQIMACCLTGAVSHKTHELWIIATYLTHWSWDKMATMSQTF